MRSRIALTYGATSRLTTHTLPPEWMYFSAMRWTALTEHPKLGRLGEISGTRELIPHESYRLVYEVGNETVWILALVHIARQWPLCATDRSAGGWYGNSLFFEPRRLIGPYVSHQANR